MSRSKSTFGALGVPVMFIRQFTRTLLLENECPMLRSARLTLLSMYNALRLSEAL